MYLCLQPFIKVQKTKAYFSRYQTKFRRRNEGKTDYRARKRLVVQDKNKYTAPRYRLVARLTNRFVIAQIVRSELNHDVIVASAYSSELERYGVSVGLKNYAAAYATGLLVARRILKLRGLDDTYKGQEDITGTIVKTAHVNDAGKKRNFWVSAVADKKPFRAVLDVGIRPTTTGARVFGVMKGASDGGLDIPHNEKRFPGYDRESKKYDAEAHKERIMGLHVSAHMQELKEEDPESYRSRYAAYLAAGLDADDIEELYTKCHAAIRKDPTAKSTRGAFKPNPKYTKPRKFNAAQRKERVQAKKAARLDELKAARSKLADDE